DTDVDAAHGSGSCALGDARSTHHRRTIRTLHTPPIAGTDYAFGWVVQPLPGLGTTLWHNGSNTTWYAFMRFAPEHNAATIVAVNIASPGATKAVSQLVEELLRTELNIAKPD
ncbi:MAG: hypothetical protein ACK462_13050, partial [Planctomyces sp.]